MTNDGYDVDSSSPQAFDPVAHVLRVLRDPAGALRRRWIWMLVVLVLGLAGTGAFLASLDPVYAAHARVVISGQQIPQDFVRSTVSESSIENINAMAGEILSQQNLSKMIDQSQLFTAEANKIPRNSLIDRLRNSIAIEPEQVVSAGRDQSRIYGVHVYYEDPVKAAEVANQLAGLFVDASIERRSRQAKLTTAFLARELERADGELRDINNQIAEYRRGHRGELPGDLNPTLAKLDRLASQRQALNLEISEREDRILILSGAKQEGALSESQKQLELLQQKLVAELAVHTEEHPNVIALRDQIARLEKAASGESPKDMPSDDRARAMRLASEEAELKRLREQVALIDKEISESDTRVDRIPGNEEDLNALLERAAVLRENYLEFLRKVQDAELAESLESTQQGPRVSILDRAEVPSAPTRPPLVYLVAGVLLSLGGALAAGIGIEVLDPIVLTADQLAGLCREPSLGSLPRL